MLALCAQPARAQPLDETGGGAKLAWSVGAGCGLALASMAIGGGLAAASDNDRQRKTGIEILAGGLALAPAVSHLIGGEGRRAAVFGGLSVSLAAVAIGLLEGSHDLLNVGRRIHRVPFGAALAMELLVSTGGLVDSLMAGERARARQRVAVFPVVARHALGLSVGGPL
jgi:hypothetical protein